MVLRVRPLVAALEKRAFPSDPRTYRRRKKLFERLHWSKVSKQYGASLGNGLPHLLTELIILDKPHRQINVGALVCGDQFDKPDAS